MTISQYGSIPYASLNSMASIDMEEIKDVLSRSATECAMLEESIAHLEGNLQSVTSERDSLRNRLSQLEILLKGRQSALIAKEEECQSLRKKQISSCCITHAVHCSVEDITLTPHSNPWLSVARGVACIAVPAADRPALSLVMSHHVFEVPDVEPIRSPPRTVYRSGRTSFASNSSSSDSVFSPRYSVVSNRVRRSIDQYRESFASVRSTATTVRSISSDSDESLDELVTHAMRLSTASGRSSTSSSVVRGSVVMRSSIESSRHSSFPKRWK